MKLIVLGDLHYPGFGTFTKEKATQWFDAREHFFNGVLEHMFKQPADLYVSIGDLTNIGSSVELEYIHHQISKYEKNFIHVLGNHDTYSMPKSMIMEIIKQPRYKSIETAEAILVFLDSTKEMVRDSWGGTMDEEQLHWFEALVQNSGTKTMLVFAHHPIYNTTFRSDMKNLFIDTDINVNAVLKQKKGQGVYFCGHNHKNSIVQRDQWWYVQTAAVMDDPGFRTIDLTEDRILIDMITLDNEDLLQSAATVYHDMIGFRHITDIGDELSERKVEIELNLQAVYRKEKVSYG